MEALKSATTPPPTKVMKVIELCGSEWAWILSDVCFSDLGSVASIGLGGGGVPMLQQQKSGIGASGTHF